MRIKLLSIYKCCIKRKYITFCLLGIILVTFLTACNQALHKNKISQSKGSQNQIVIGLGWGDSPTGFDPILGWGYHDPPLFQSTLLRRDKNHQLLNDLAQSYTLSADKKVWTFNIRPDVRFSDNKPLTAEDVAYTFNKAKENAGLTDVTVLDKAVAKSTYEVKLYLKKPQITFINRITQLGIVPKHAYNSNYGRHPIGSGPYQLVQWDEGQQMIVEANPNYYGNQPAIKRIVFLFIKGDAVFTAAKAGRIQLANIPPFLANKSIAGMKLHILKTYSRLGLMFPYVPDTGRKTAQGNPIGNNVTANRAIRQAVNYAINRKELVAGVLEGYGFPSYSPASGLPWDVSSAVIKDGNLNKAKQILASDGWKDNDGDGIVEKEGITAKFKIVYPIDNNTSQGLALAISQMLKYAGIKVNVEGKSWSDISRRMHRDVGLFPWGIYDPLELYNLYHSSAAQGDWRNSGYYSNQSVDQALDKGMAAASENEALQYWKQAQWNGKTGPITLGDSASAWLVNLNQTYFISSCLDIGMDNQTSSSYNSSIIINITNWKWVCQKM